MRLAIAGIALVTVWISYAVISARVLGSDLQEVAPYLYAPLLIVAGGWLGHLLALRIPPRIVSLGLAMTSAWMVAGVLLTAEPGKAPIGYPNANAALGIQLLAVATLVTLTQRAGRLGWAAIALSMLAILANASRAGTAVAMALLAVCALTLIRPRLRIRWPAVTTALAAATAGATLVVFIARRVHWAPEVNAAIEPTRRYIWNMAWGAFREHPTMGLGPGGFAEVNVLAHDPDTLTAHSLPLQVAAELGIVGVVLLGALSLCGLAVAARARPAAAAWVTIAAWTALTLHSFVDHLLEFWPIPLAAGLVLGYGLVAQPHSEAQDEVV